MENSSTVGLACSGAQLRSLFTHQLLCCLPLLLVQPVRVRFGRLRACSLLRFQRFLTRSAPSSSASLVRAAVSVIHLISWIPVTAPRPRVPARPPVACSSRLYTRDRFPRLLQASSSRLRSGVNLVVRLGGDLHRPVSRRGSVGFGIGAARSTQLGEISEGVLAATSSASLVRAAVPANRLIPSTPLASSFHRTPRL